MRTKQHYELGIKSNMPLFYISNDLIRCGSWRVVYAKCRLTNGTETEPNKLCRNNICVYTSESNLLDKVPRYLYVNIFIWCERNESNYFRTGE